MKAQGGAAMNPIDIVLDRLVSHRLRPSGAGRWRACCPAHGGSNPSSLSIGLGDDGAVLLHCWGGCDAEAVVASLGLELADLFPSRMSGAKRPKHRHLLTDRQALSLLADESNLVAVAAANVAHGIELTDVDRARVLQAAGRIAYLRDEVAK